MTYYHSGFVKSVGGLKGRQMRRLVGETWEDMVTVSRLRPEISVINVPSRKIDSWKSRSLPVLRIDADEIGDDYLQEIGSDQVSEDHILVQTWILRREIYSRSFEVTEEIADFFDRGIRGSLRELLKRGNWIDHPESWGLEKLNSRLEKIDLGRRSDLNFSSNQSLEFGKYDRDARRADLEDSGDPNLEYQRCSSEARARLRVEKPWLAAKWIEQFGL